MYRVKRAIIMAAGRGSRMRELTEHTPKPMLRVNGVRIIDTMIRGLLENGINEIIIIVGYLKERFQEVADDYPEVRLIENPYYETCNNISSIYTVRDLLEEAMILEGDQYFRSYAPLAAEFEHSEYNGFRQDKPSKEWIVDTAPDGRILATHTEGADHGFEMQGVSRWTPEDARKLKALLEEEFEIRQNRGIYWDEVPVVYHKDEFELYLREVERGTRVELDTVEELAKVDPSYKSHTKEAAS
ncbi:MAG: NTP transferase domain-containing protein [Eubacterium sp.]|nr:NTP transferase domain-containing protein [Eubacterium sp.]